MDLYEHAGKQHGLFPSDQSEGDGILSLGGKAGYAEYCPDRSGKGIAKAGRKIRAASSTVCAVITKTYHEREVKYY